MKKWTKSVWNAIDGIHIILKEERNFRIMVFFLITSLLLSFILKLSVLEWIIVIVLNGLMLSAEMTNTAIERITESEVHDGKVKKIKDISAGATLILAIMSFVVGLIIFLPKILELLLL